MAGIKEFFEAIKKGELAKVVEELNADRSLANARTEKGVSAVTMAVYYGKDAIAAELVRAGAELDIFEASLMGDVARVKALLDKQPALISSYSADGFPPLGLAAYVGRLKVVEFLLERGADANLVGRNEGKFTALTGAVANSHQEVVAMLLKHGADARYRYEGGSSPLAEAAANGSFEIVEMLLAGGADPDSKDDKGRTPLSHAEAKGHTALVERLRAVASKSS
ncbi:MAG TPA: ankyrin repeat domain-containing protein [Thermoplasmata archaeon]|nr:ankyrin repeat domain-containing protein [Thermoplasmata archaeon]